MKSTTKKTAAPKKDKKVNLSDWNVANPDRVLAHGPNSRFNPIKRKGANQYNINTYGYFDDTYRWLIGTTNEVTNVTGHFTCWVPQGEGIEYRPDSGYNRMDYKNKIFCHRVVWLYFNPGKKVENGYDISHLCGNPSCCRYTHLLCEPRPDNIARINCVGYLVHDKDPSEIIKICTHNIPCKKAQYINDSNVVVSINNADN